MRKIDLDFTNVRPPIVPEVKRDNKGRWMEGCSGNPNGRPGKKSKIQQGTIELFAQNTNAALCNLLELMNSADLAIRLQATKYFLDKGLGRDFQAFEDFEDTDNDLTIHIVRKKEKQSDKL